MKKTELSLAEIPFPDTSTIERQVIADAIGNPETIVELSAIVNEDMFTDDVRKYLWKSMLYMFQTGQTIDIPSFASRTGNYYINEIITRNIDPSTPFTTIQHGMALRAASVRRRAYYSAIRIIEVSTKPDLGELDVYAAAQQLNLDIQGESPVVAETKIDSVLDDVEKEVDENLHNTLNGIRTRVPTGFKTLDYFTYKGWGPGQLIILAARPSIGKTAIMLQMAKAAASSGVPATIFSLEMTKEELGKRLIFSTGLVRPQDVTTGRVDRENAFGPAKRAISELPIYINDESRTLAGILSRLTVSVTQGRCGIAFIDYLGLISIDESGRIPMYQQIAKATRELKNAAKRQKIPIVLLCQLNREAAKVDEPPQLYHLRDSGAIEQDADIVMMLEQNGKVRDGSERPDINIWLRKNRQFLKDVKVTVEPNSTYSEFREVPQSGDTPAPEPEHEPQEDEQEDF